MDEQNPAYKLANSLTDLSQYVDSCIASLDLFDSFRSFEISLTHHLFGYAGFRINEHLSPRKKRRHLMVNTNHIEDNREKARIALFIFDFIEQLEAQRVELKVYSVIHPLLAIKECPWQFSGNAYHSIIESNRMGRTVMAEWLRKNIVY